LSKEKKPANLHHKRHCDPWELGRNWKQETTKYQILSTVNCGFELAGTFCPHVCIYEMEILSNRHDASSLIFNPRLPTFKVLL